MIYQQLLDKYSTQEKIAEAIGVSQKTVSTWSDGILPREANVGKIAEILDVKKGFVYSNWGTQAAKKQGLMP